MGFGRGDGRRDISGKESEMKYQMRDNYEISNYTRSNLDKKRRTDRKNDSEGDFSIFQVAFVIIVLAIVMIILLI